MALYKSNMIEDNVYYFDIKSGYGKYSINNGSLTVNAIGKGTTLTYLYPFGYFNIKGLGLSTLTITRRNNGILLLTQMQKDGSLVEAIYSNATVDISNTEFLICVAYTDYMQIKFN